MGMNRTDDDVNGKDDEAYCQISSVITAEVAHRFLPLSRSEEYG